MSEEVDASIVQSDSSRVKELIGVFEARASSVTPTRELDRLETSSSEFVLDEVSRPTHGHADQVTQVTGPPENFLLSDDHLDASGHAKVDEIPAMESKSAEGVEAATSFRPEDTRLDVVSGSFVNTDEVSSPKDHEVANEATLDQEQVAQDLATPAASLPPPTAVTKDHDILDTPFDTGEIVADSSATPTDNELTRGKPEESLSPFSNPVPAEDETTKPVVASAIPAEELVDAAPEAKDVPVDRFAAVAQPVAEPEVSKAKIDAAEASVASGDPLVEVNPASDGKAVDRFGVYSDNVPVSTAPPVQEDEALSEDAVEPTTVDSEPVSLPTDAQETVPFISAEQHELPDTSKAEVSEGAPLVDIAIAEASANPPVNDVEDYASKAVDEASVAEAPESAPVVEPTNEPIPSFEGTKTVQVNPSEDLKTTDSFGAYAEDVPVAEPKDDIPHLADVQENSEEAPAVSESAVSLVSGPESDEPIAGIHVNNETLPAASDATTASGTPVDEPEQDDLPEISPAEDTKATDVSGHHAEGIAVTEEDTPIEAGTGVEDNKVVNQVADEGPFAVQESAAVSESESGIAGSVPPSEHEDLTAAEISDEPGAVDEDVKSEGHAEILEETSTLQTVDAATTAPESFATPVEVDVGAGVVSGVETLADVAIVSSIETDDEAEREASFPATADTSMPVAEAEQSLEAVITPKATQEDMLNISSSVTPVQVVTSSDIPTPTPPQQATPGQILAAFQAELVAEASSIAADLRPDLEESNLVVGQAVQVPEASLVDATPSEMVVTPSEPVVDNEHTSFEENETPVVSKLEEKEPAPSVLSEIQTEAVPSPQLQVAITVDEDVIDTDAPSQTGGLEIDRPKSPWTPSYSVTTQGPGLTPEDHIPEVELLDKIGEQSSFASKEDIKPAGELADTTTAQAVASTGTDGEGYPVSSAEEVQASSEAREVKADTSAPELRLPDSAPESQSISAVEIERPKSPWTPSYSVTNQGPDLAHEPPVSHDEDAATTGAPIITFEDELVVPEVEETTERQASIEPVPRPTSPWTPSYSVSNQGSPILEPAPAKKETFKRTTSTSSLAVESSDEAEPPRPTSPWTPSYSVSRQGSPVPPVVSLPDEAHKSNEERQEAPASPSVVVQPSEESPPPDWTPSYSISRQGSPRHEVKSLGQEEHIDPEAAPQPLPVGEGGSSRSIKSEDEIVAPVPITKESSTSTVTALQIDTSPSREAPERPRSPWTPSYSVTRQGSRVFSDSDVKSTGDLQPFPSAEDDATTDFHSTRSVVTSQETDAEVSSPRTRYESMTSSLIFPPAAKAPEGRASLDNAQGEFVSSKPSSPTDVKMPLAAAPEHTQEDGASVAESDTSADTAVTAESTAPEERKGRWCVIM